MPLAAPCQCFHTPEQHEPGGCTVVQFWTDRLCRCSYDGSKPEYTGKELLEAHQRISEPSEGHYSFDKHLKWLNSSIGDAYKEAFNVYIVDSFDLKFDKWYYISNSSSTAYSVQVKHPARVKKLYEKLLRSSSRLKALVGMSEEHRRHWLSTDEILDNLDDLAPDCSQVTGDNKRCCICKGCEKWILIEDVKEAVEAV